MLVTGAPLGCPLPTVGDKVVGFIVVGLPVGAYMGLAEGFTVGALVGY